MSDKFKFSEEERADLKEYIFGWLMRKKDVGDNLIDKVESIIQDRGNSIHDGASAEDVLDKEGFDFEAFKFENEYSAKAIINAMHQFAKSEVEKAVAEKDKYIRQVQIGMQSVINMKDAEIEALKLDITASACTAPSSIGEDEIITEAEKEENAGGNYTKNHLPSIWVNRQASFIAGAKWAISRLSERKIVLPSEPINSNEKGK